MHVHAHVHVNPCTCTCTCASDRDGLATYWHRIGWLFKDWHLIGILVQGTPLKVLSIRLHSNRPQREWVWEVREVKSEKKKLSLFFEKCKVKKICFHSFSRSAKWKKNAFTLFREVKSEIKMLRERDREVKILENSWQFSRNEILQQNYSTRRRRWSTSKMTSPTWR